MSRPRPSAPTAPTDPLADLRPKDAPAGPPQPEVDAEVVEIRPTASKAVQDAMRAEIVVAFHADTVAAGTLHKGGVCACRYMATLAVRSVLGAPVEAEERLTDLEPAPAPADA